MSSSLRLLVATTLWVIATASGAFGQSQPGRPAAAAARLDGTLLTLQPQVAWRSAIAQVIGPAGYEARRGFADGEAISLDLRADGYYASEPPEEGSPAEDPRLDTPNPERRVATSPLPGRYHWSVFLTGSGDEIVRASGSFDLGAPPPVDRSAAYPEEPAIDPAAPTVATPPSTASTAQDSFFIGDGSNDGFTHLSLDSDTPTGTTIEIWQVRNNNGFFQITEDGAGGDNQLTAISILSDANGQIGIGTVTPAQQVHVVGGGFTGIRVEDVVGSGSAWDLQVVNSLFQLEDLLTGNDALVIEEGVRDNALYVESDGDIGFGTSSPLITLDLRDTTPGIRLQETDELFAAFTLRVETEDGRRLLTIDGGGTQALQIDQDTGAVAIGTSLASRSSGAHLSDGGEWVSASSRALKESIEPLALADALAALAALEPVAFNYRVEPGDRQIGFIAEDVPDLVATPERTGLSAMDIVGVLTRVVQEQQRRIEELESHLGALGLGEQMR